MTDRASVRLIEDMGTLESLYGLPPGGSDRTRPLDHLTPGCRSWIEAAPFCILSTLGPDGVDSSPRGEDGPVVRVMDDRTLALPDWRGNRRLDSLRNILRNGQCALAFLVPGAAHVLRVRGTARLTDDAALRASFATADGIPVTVALISIAAVQLQRTRAVARSGLWSGIDRSKGLPAGDALLAEIRARLAEDGGITSLVVPKPV